MSEISAEFIFVPTFSFAVSDDGQLVRPFMGKGVGPSALVDKYVYAFAEQVGGGDPWQRPLIFKIVPPAETNGFPGICSVIGTDSDGLELLSEPEETVVLSTTASGGGDNIKYFFLCLDHPLLPDTEQALAQQSDITPFPIVSLEKGSETLFVGPDGTHDVGPSPDLRPAVQVVDPYEVGTQLSRTFRIRCNRVVSFTDPRAGVKDEPAETEQRLAKHRLALQLDALRKAGKNLSGKLKTGAGSLDNFLRDMDPNQPEGELGKRIRQREDFALALIRMTTAPVWNLLEQDSRGTVERGKLHYGRHLEVTCSIHELLLSTELGEELWVRIADRFPIQADGVERATPENGVEELAKRFIFSEKATVEPREGWEKPALLTGGNAAFGLYAATTKALARASLAKVGDAAGGIISSQELDDFASGALRSKAGLTAYRWAYHLRNDFFLERVTIDGVEKLVTWVDKGQTFSVSNVEVTINAEPGEFSTRFANSGFDVGHVGRVLNLASFGYSLMALNVAIEKKQEEVPTRLLSTGAAALSLIGDPFVAKLFLKPDQLAAGATGANVVKYLGIAGAFLGIAAGVSDALDANDNGEGDVALVVGGGAVFGGAIAAWAGAASIFAVAGPPGWVMLAGTAVGILAPIVAAQFFQDDDLEEMVEHSVFGNQHGEAHDAPKIALCAGNKFNHWAGEGLQSLERQQLGFDNFIWSYRVRGVRTTNPMQSDPTVEILPSRLVPESCVDIDADIAWKQGSAEVTLRGTVRITFTQNPKFENLSGDRFAGELETLVSLFTTQGPPTHHVEWSIFPEDQALRNQVQRMPLTLAKLTFRLKPFGPDRDLVVPVPPANDPNAKFEYELMRSTNLNRDAQGSSSIYT